MLDALPWSWLPAALALACYLTCLFRLTQALLHQHTVNTRLILLIMLAGLLLHALVLAPQLWAAQGMDFGLFNVLSLTGWLMLAFTLIFSSYRPVLALNLLALPLAAAALLAGQLWHAPYQPITGLSRGLEGHIILSLAAYCLLFMAAIHACLLWLQHRELKHQSRHRLWVAMLPSQQSMNALLFDMIGLGFGLLTLALLLGALAVDDLLGQHLAHKTFFSILSWLLFGGLLLGHWRFGWRGQKAVNLTLWGFVLLVVGFIGSKLVLEMMLATK